MATVGGPEWDISAALRQRMREQGLTIERLAVESGVQQRTIQGWLTEGRQPRQIQLARVENVVGDMGPPVAFEPAKPPSVELALRRLRAAERSIREAKEILRQLEP
jgi:transcriptional regulator with XRE-family HTH domain